MKAAVLHSCVLPHLCERGLQGGGEAGVEDPHAEHQAALGLRSMSWLYLAALTEEHGDQQHDQDQTDC